MLYANPETKHGYFTVIVKELKPIYQSCMDDEINACFFFSDSDVHLMQLQTNEDKLPRIHIRYNSLKINYNEGS